LRRHPQACSSSAAAPSSSGTPKMPAKKAPKPRKFFMQLTKDSWTTSATPPMPPPLPSAMKPVQSPPRDEDSPGWRTEQFLMPADCFQLLQRTTDPQLRAIELLTQCRVRVYSDSGVEQPDCSRLTVRYRDRCGDPRTCERLLNSLLARRQPRGLPLPACSSCRQNRHRQRCQFRPPPPLPLPMPSMPSASPPASAPSLKTFYAAAASCTAAAWRPRPSQRLNTPPFAGPAALCGCLRSRCSALTPPLPSSQPRARPPLRATTPASASRCVKSAWPGTASPPSSASPRRT
ncbi:hypothetical protein BOX15_Mlig028674g1, partial [Macrostomum lignano]